MIWLNFLHLYQPPNQSKDMVDLITYESYERIISLIEMHPSVHVTMNISGSLLELFDKYNHLGLISRYRVLIEKGQIELVGTAAYHPILPLISESEIIKQIQYNEELHKKYLGINTKLKGFYFPEMAYSLSAAKIVEKMGYKWIILDDEGHYPNNVTDSNKRYVIKDTSLEVFFRNRNISKTFPPEHILTHFEELKNQTLITAHDGELYGHHHKDDRGYYEKIFTHSDIQHMTISDYSETLTDIVTINPTEGNWETTLEDRSNNVPFALWNDPQNNIHQDLWKFARSTAEILTKHTDDPSYSEIELNFHKGLASCTWWWASNKKIGPFSPITWNPSEIEEGVKELLSVTRSLKKIPIKVRLDIEERAHTLMLNIWKKHWELYTT